MGWTSSDREETLRSIWSLLKLHAPSLKKLYGIDQIGLFGSWADGTAQPWSDVDILLDWSNPDLYAYFEIQDFLEEILGRKVDLVIQKNLREHVKSYVLGSVRYAA